VIEALGLREDLFPPLVASGAVAGTLTRKTAGPLGLPAGLPVAAGAGDTAAALLGSGILTSGPVQLTVGTGGQIVSPREDFAPDPHLRIHLYRAAHDHPSGRFYAMAAVQNAALALEWVLKVLKVSWEEAYPEAFSVPPGAGGVTFLPYLSGERTPHFDPHARGAWVGLGLSHERGHLLRAAFEGVTFALREGSEALEETGVRAPELRLAGGGALHEPWRRLLADVLGRPLRPVPDEVARSASARGAALLAGTAVGVYRTVADTLALAPEPGEAILPRGGASCDVAYTRYKELYPRLYGR
jgi:xylulokinase